MFKNTTIKVVQTTLMKPNIFYVSENEMFRDTTVSQPAGGETIVFVVFICGKQHAPQLKTLVVGSIFQEKKFGLGFGFWFKVWV